MADINVERRRGRLWPALLAFVLLALLVWGLYQWREDDQERVEAARRLPSASPAATGVPASAPAVSLSPGGAASVEGAVAEYTRFVALPPAEGGPDHLYTALGIARLTTALRQVAEAEPRTRSTMARAAAPFYATADLLVSSPDSLRQHADWVRAAATASVALMQGMADTRAPGDAALQREIRAAREAAEGIDPQRALLGQRDRVRAFFQAAGDPLRRLAGVEPPAE